MKKVVIRTKAKGKNGKPFFVSNECEISLDTKYHHVEFVASFTDKDGEEVKFPELKLKPDEVQPLVIALGELLQSKDFEALLKDYKANKTDTKDGAKLKALEAENSIYKDKLAKLEAKLDLLLKQDTKDEPSTAEDEDAAALAAIYEMVNKTLPKKTRRTKKKD